MSFGGQTGFNWQSGPWVLGIEGDAQQAQQRGRATIAQLRGCDLQSGGRKPLASMRQ